MIIKFAYKPRQGKWAKKVLNKNAQGSCCISFIWEILHDGEVLKLLKKSKSYDDELLIYLFFYNDKILIRKYKMKDHFQLWSP